jgi:CxxC motif-containing protein
MIMKELICIGCPIGCELQVKLDSNEIIEVTGNTCKKGEEYAKKECTNPTRIVTSSVGIKNGEIGMVAVKTERDIPKDKILDCIKALKGIVVNAPINIGDVIVENILDTGVNIVATRKVAKIDKKVGKIA